MSVSTRTIIRSGSRALIAGSSRLTVDPNKPQSRRLRPHLPDPDPFFLTNALISPFSSRAVDSSQLSNRSQILSRVAVSLPASLSLNVRYELVQLAPWRELNVGDAGDG